MNKHQVIVNGQKLTRNSKNRQYTHVVVRPPTEKKPHWGSLGWASRLDLAEKNRRSWLAFYPEAFILEVGAVVEWADGEITHK